MEIEEILRDWGFPGAIIQCFKDNLIDEEQLPLLTDEVLKELIPQVGPRLMPRKKILELQLANIEHRDCSFTTFIVSSSNVSDDSLINDSINNRSESSKPVVIEVQDNALLDNNDCNNLLSFLRARFDDFDLKTLLSTSALGKVF